jgi:hypothetical protein
MDDMYLPDIWRKVQDRIGFYTSTTCQQIPEKPGIYAWFLPLWLLKGDLATNLKMIHNFLLYDSKSQGCPERLKAVDFNWDAIELRIKKILKEPVIGEDMERRWNEKVEDPGVKAQVEKILMQASIFMPPLYVGRAGDLRRRYFEHVEGPSKGIYEDIDKNVFHTRFKEHAKKLGYPLRIEDLLFVCILTEDETVSRACSSDEMNHLIEEIMIRMCKPIFSSKI